MNIESILKENKDCIIDMISVTYGRAESAMINWHLEYTFKLEVSIHFFSPRISARFSFFYNDDEKFHSDVKKLEKHKSK